MTPESQGGTFNSQFEIQQTDINLLTADVSQASVEDGVTYQVVPRLAFAYSSSLLEQIDLFWNHPSEGNSLFGAKYQFLGAARTAKGAGHKMAITAAVGGNDYETDGVDSVEFELKGQEFQFLYGYRLNEYFLGYSNLSYARYNFLGEISSNDPEIDGLKPNYETKIVSLYGGAEFSFSSFFAKVECGYQRLKTTFSANKSHFIYGYALGISW